MQRDDFLECLPEKSDFRNIELSENSLYELVNEPLSNFEYIPSIQPLRRLATVLGERAQKSGHPLLLLFDKSDYVPAPALIPIFELLPQSANYVALLALRPGHGANVLRSICENTNPGDTYDLYQLGQYPRSQEWRNFVSAATEAQFGGITSKALSSQEMEALLISAGESPRLALRILWSRELQSEGGTIATEKAIKSVRSKFLSSIEDALRRWRPNFKALIREIHQKALTEMGEMPFELPVTLLITNTRTGRLFYEFSDAQELLAAGLRCGIFAKLNGDIWTPLSMKDHVEVAPIALWSEQDKLWEKTHFGEGITIDMTEAQFLRGSSGGTPRKSVFIAYRMDFPESQRFTIDLKRAIKKYPHHMHITVRDASDLPVGASWPDEIRNRLKKSNLVVGDVTGTRNDVIFELGFAAGLCRQIIPTVNKKQKKSDVPVWLGALLIGHYEDQKGLNNLVTSIYTHLDRSSVHGRKKLPDPIPNKVTWVSNLPWSLDTIERCYAVAEKEELLFEVTSEGTSYQHILETAARSGLLILCLDGRFLDRLMHFLCGIATATQEIGYGATSKLKRRVLMVPKMGKSELIAASLQHCFPVVQIVGLKDIPTQMEKYATEWRKWTTGGRS